MSDITTRVYSKTPCGGNQPRCVARASLLPPPYSLSPMSKTKNYMPCAYAHFHTTTINLPPYVPPCTLHVWLITPLKQNAHTHKDVDSPAKP